MTPVLRRLPLILIVAALAPAALAAQTLQPGARVRVLAPSAADTLLTGTVVALDSASLLVAPAVDAEAVPIPLAGVERMEVSRGRAPSTLAGAVVGTALGALVGYGLATLATDPEDCEFVCGAVEAVSAATGGTLGLVMGALVGAGTPHGPERWHPVPVPPAPAAP